MTIIGQPVLKFVAVNCTVEEGEQSFKALCERLGTFRTVFWFSVFSVKVGTVKSTSCNRHKKMKSKLDPSSGHWHLPKPSTSNMISVDVAEH